MHEYILPGRKQDPVKDFISVGMPSNLCHDDTVSTGNTALLMRLAQCYQAL